MNPTNSEHAQLLQAQSHIWNHVLNFLNSFSLKSAIDLGIPDIIHNHGRPMTIPELVAALPIPSDKDPFVPRLMRLLVHSGFFESKQEGYVLTNTSLFLLKDNPLSQAPFLKTLLDPVFSRPAESLGLWFQTNDPTPFYTSYGKSIWEYTGYDLAGFSDSMNATFANDCRLISKVLIVDKYKWIFDGLRSLVDVGGGTGTFGREISEAFPNLECTVFDLPNVVAGLDGSSNLKYVGGNMFEAIPPADGVILKSTLHDWNDENCLKILKRCKEAITKQNGGKGGKVIIIDMVIMKDNGDGGDKEHVETQLLFDMLTMVLVIGKQRDEEEWAKLFSDAGFSGYKISPILGVRSLIEVFP